MVLAFVKREFSPTCYDGYSPYTMCLESLEDRYKSVYSPFPRNLYGLNESQVVTSKNMTSFSLQFSKHFLNICHVHRKLKQHMQNVWRPLKLSGVLSERPSTLPCHSRTSHYFFPAPSATRTLLSSWGPIDSLAPPFCSCQMLASTAVKLLRDERSRRRQEDPDYPRASRKCLSFETYMTKCFLPIISLSGRGKKRLQVGSLATHIPSPVTPWVQRKPWLP